MTALISKYIIKKEIKQKQKQKQKQRRKLENGNDDIILSILCYF